MSHVNIEQLARIIASSRIPTRSRKSEQTTRRIALAAQGTSLGMPSHRYDAAQVARGRAMDETTSVEDTTETALAPARRLLTVRQFVERHHWATEGANIPQTRERIRCLYPPYQPSGTYR